MVIQIKDEIFERMEELSPAEKRVARVLLAEYPSAGLTSAAALAKSAGTSTPTVLRLVTSLGIASYPEFQKHLREEITHRMNSPVSRAEGHTNRSDGFGSSTAERLALIDKLFTGVPPSELNEAVRVLGSMPRDVVISGGYFSQYVGRILALQLDQIIPNVFFADDPLGHDIGRYLSLRKDCVVIVLDLRRYELSAKKICAMAKQRGATVIVITDEELSPCAEDADIVLPVAVGGIPFDSFAALVVLVESLVEALFVRLGDKALERMTEWENAIQIHRVFRAGAIAPEAAVAAASSTSGTVSSGQPQNA